MRRVCTGIVASLVFTGTMLTLPVYAAPVAVPEPVPADITELALGSVADPQGDAVVTEDGAVSDAGPDAPVDASTASPTGPGEFADAGDVVASTGDEAPGVPALTVSRPAISPFETVGVSWEADPSLGAVTTQLRVRSSDGEWGEWTTLEVDDAAPVEDGAPVAGSRGGTAPYWTGPAEGVEVVVQGEDGGAPADVRVAVIDPGTSDADALAGGAQPAGTAYAASDMPRIYTRAEWGADESIRTWDPEYASTIKAATLHHTADGNNYTAAQVPAMLRAIYAFHTQGRGWGDIGYNVVVDKYGRAFEGRYGGLASTVIGAHAGGFNTSTFGVSMLGNYDTAPVPQATVDTVEALLAWKFSLYGVDPYGSTVLTSGGGGTSLYAAGQRVTLPTIFGHRNVGSTSCPGRYGYGRLGEIRDGVAALVDLTPRTLVRTPESASVYVVSGTTKYPVTDLNTMSAMAPLGPVGYVAQQYLDRLATGPRMTRIVASPAGTVYFLDAGIRLPFSTCAQVADYGGSCSSMVQWNQALIDEFVAGPAITKLYRTTSGKAFVVAEGVKREVADDAALAAAGLLTTGVTLLESGIVNLPYGPPVTRDGIALASRTAATLTVAVGGTFTTVPAAYQATSALRSLPVRSLDQASIARLPGAVRVPGLFLAEGGGSRVFLVTDTGLRHVLDGTSLPPSVPSVSQAFLAIFSSAGQLPGAPLVKAATASTVFLVEGGARRRVASWSDLVAFSGTANPEVVTVDQRLLDLVPAGPARLPVGAMVHSPRSSSVYFVNGAHELIPVGSFATSAEVGARGLVAVPDSDVAGYSVRSAGLTTALGCGGQTYLGLGGRLYRVTPDAAAHYSLTVTSVEQMVCAALPAAGDLTRFLRAPDGTIYHVVDGAKRPIGSYARYAALGGTSQNTIQVSAFALGLIPTGAAA